MRSYRILLIHTGILFVSLIWCFSCSAATVSGADSERMLQVPASKILALQSKLQRLNQINQQSLKDWQNQQEKLKALEEKCSSLEKKLLMQKAESEKQEKLLQNVNQSFQTYSKEMKKQITKHKIQKGIWIGVSAILLGVAVSK